MSKKKQPAKPNKGKRNEAASRDVRLSQHPRAQRQITMLKSWGGLGGAVLAAYASWHAGAPFYDVAMRALLWGTLTYVAVWACAQQVWRYIAVAEVRAAEREILERVRADEAHEAEAEEAAEAPTAQLAGGR